MAADAVARAIACFEASDDAAFLRDVLRTIRPRAEAATLRAAKQGRDVPPPGNIKAAPEPASPAEALETVRATKDFSHLQAMARAAGRRAELLAQRN
jgi:hypothetical protein